VAGIDPDVIRERPAAHEREGELAAIRAALEAAGSGHGRLVVFEGAAGIGKSSLLGAARSEASDRGFTVLSARGAELERDHAFGVVLRLLEQHVAAGAQESPNPVLRGQAALAAPLLDHTAPPADHAATSDRFALIHGLYWCVVNIAEARPTLLLIDDLHWADDMSMQFAAYIAERLGDLPVAMLVAVRSGDPGAERDTVERLPLVPEAQSILLAELSTDAVGKVVSDVLGETPSREFVEACRAATGGNPLLVHEVAATVAADPRPWTAIASNELAAFTPQSLARRVDAQLAQLGDDTVAVARACALLGGDVPLPWAARLANVGFDDAAAAAERLLAARIISSTDPVVFAHPIVQSAVYAATPGATRPASHLAAARLLRDHGAEAERVAQHLLAGTPADEPWAVRALHDAGRRAAQKGVPESAARYLRRGVELTSDPQVRAAMLIDLGLVEAACGQTTSLVRFERALTMVGSDDDRARALHALGQTLYRYGRHADAAAAFLNALDLLGPEDREARLAYEASFFCAGAYLESLRAEAAQRLAGAAASIPPHGDLSPAEATILALYALTRAATQPCAPDDAALVRRALTADMEAIPAGVVALTHAVLALLMAGEPGEALDAVERLIADARQRGDTLAFGEALWVRSLALHERGRLRDAISDAHGALLRVEAGWQTIPTGPASTLASCLVDTGDLDEAAAQLERVDRPSSDAAGADKYFHCARGRLHLARGEHRLALADFLAIGEIRYGADNPAFMDWRSLAGLAAHHAGDTSRALELIDAEIALSDRAQLPAHAAIARCRRVAVLQPPDAQAVLSAAVDVLERAERPLALAQALVQLGGVLRRAGKRVMCREPLRRALDLAHACDAGPLEHHAREELLASGARPRRAALSGVDALTPSERRIAELAATGRTSRSIAEELFLTKNTVEWHLSNAFRKLGIRSRGELADQLG